LISKEDVSEGCTKYAQGGICAVLDQHDSVDKHVHDTMIAGAFLNDARAVETVCSEGARRVLELVEFGAEFTRNDNGSLHLTREGGHSDRRIVHAADITGAEIERALVHTARQSSNIDFFEHCVAMDFVTPTINRVKTCVGVDVLDNKDSSVHRFLAPVTMLASGGGGQVYPNTTNPSLCTGDGIAMAHRSRAAIANMEFVQFHPTGLFLPGGGSRRFLISEAVRGEGGLLYNLAGDRFMTNYDDRLELAPRDVVARSIDNEMKSRGESHVWLDISHKPSDFVTGHFPNIAAHCLENGIDIRNDPIPVVPTQHYMCGGVQTGLHGETSVKGLFAAGEVACTGLHGANRLASNSLLEGLVFGHRAADAGIAALSGAKDLSASALARAAREAAAMSVAKPRGLSSASHEWVDRKRSEIKSVLWESAGIVRSTKGMTVAIEQLAHLYVECEEMVTRHPVNRELLELKNLVTVGELIITSALMRNESRGLHYVLDYPDTHSGLQNPTLIHKPFGKRYNLAPIHSKLASTGGIGASVSQYAPLQISKAALHRTGRKAAKGRPELSVRSSPVNSDDC